MAAGVIGITIIAIALSYIRGNTYEWHNDRIIPNGCFGLLTSAALSIFTFPSELPSNGGTYKKLIGFGIVLAVALSIAVTAGCLSSITQFRFVYIIKKIKSNINNIILIFLFTVKLNHLSRCPF